MSGAVVVKKETLRREVYGGGHAICDQCWRKLTGDDDGYRCKEPVRDVMCCYCSNLCTSKLFWFPGPGRCEGTKCRADFNLTLEGYTVEDKMEHQKAKEKQAAKEKAEGKTQPPKEETKKAVAKTVKNKVIQLERTPGAHVSVGDDLTYGEAAEFLLNKEAEEESITSVSFSERVHPADGGHALRLAIEEVLGLAVATDTPGFFGKTPPRKIRVEVDHGIFETVWWGRYALSIGKDKTAWLEPGVGPDGSFYVNGQAKVKHLVTVNKILDRVREIVKNNSLFRGRAFRAAFTNSDGDPLPWPEFSFWELAKDSPIYNPGTEDAINFGILTRVRHRDLLPEMGMQFRSGVLLVGDYGVGKTMLASQIAREAIARGITFIYVNNIRDLVPAMQYGRNYQPAVIFAEDLDEIEASGVDDSPLVMNIRNTLDGVDTKTLEVMVVLTTNHVDRISQALLRPGRLSVVKVPRPNAETIARLIQRFGGALIGSTLEELVAAGHALEGTIPDMVRQAVNDAKLAVLGRTGALPGPGTITAEDILVVARSMEVTRELLKPKPRDTRSDVEKAASVLAGALHHPVGTKGLHPTTLLNGEAKEHTASAA